MAVTDTGSVESRRAAIRDKALTELPDLIEHAIDTVRADGKPSDMVAMIAQLTKIAGVDQEKKNPYDGIPVVNISIGSNMQMTATVVPPDAKPEAIPLPTVEVIDVEPTTSKPTPEKIMSDELTAAFSMLGDGMLAELDDL